MASFFFWMECNLVALSMAGDCFAAVQTETKGGGFMILWSLWLGINDVVWNGKKCDHHYVISKARSTLLKSQLAQQITERQPVERVEASWKAPMAGQFKCNVDVSIQQNGIFDFGVIINDSNGLCCAGKLVT